MKLKVFALVKTTFEKGDYFSHGDSVRDDYVGCVRSENFTTAAESLGATIDRTDAWKVEGTEDIKFQYEKLANNKRWKREDHVKEIKFTMRNAQLRLPHDPLMRRRGKLSVSFDPVTKELIRDVGISYYLQYLPKL